MKPLTVFQAYVKARIAMEDAVGMRGTGRELPAHWRIAVDKDCFALEWQRRNRQAERFAEWLTRFLEGLE